MKKKLSIRSFINSLFFDKELVTVIKKVNAEKAHLYNLLFSGKITMKEYLNAEKI